MAQIASVLQTARVVVSVQAVLGKAASVAPVASAPLEHAPAYCEKSILTPELCGQKTPIHSDVFDSLTHTVNLLHNNTCLCNDIMTDSSALDFSLFSLIVHQWARGLKVDY